MTTLKKVMAAIVSVGLLICAVAYAANPANRLGPGFWVAEQASAPAPTGQARVWINSGTHHLMRTDTGNVDHDIESAAGGTGNYSFSANAMDLTGAAQMSIAPATATSILLGQSTSFAASKTLTVNPRGLVIGSGTAPTCAPNANAGSTATCNSIAGTDTAFKFVITAGGTGGATGTWATITFNGTWGHTPMCVASWNKAGAASAYEFGVDYAGSSTTTMKVSLLYGADFLPAATTFVVHCIDPGV
jgi:hypothetical protein